MLTQRISVVSLLGYAVFLAGFVIMVVNGGMQLPWMEWAVGFMAVGAVIAERGRGKE